MPTEGVTSLHARTSGTSPDIGTSRATIPHVTRPKNEGRDHSTGTVPSRAADEGGPSPVAQDVLNLQETIGNRRVAELLSDAGAAPTVGARAQPRPVLQSQTTTTTPPAAPSGASASTAMRPWREASRDFSFTRISDPGRTSSVANELLRIAERTDDDVDVLNEGSELVVWFEDRGDTASADRMTEALRTRFRRRAADPRQALPTGGLLRVGSTVLGDPGGLIELGERAARAGHHDRALTYFMAAHEILLLYVLRGTADTQRTLDTSRQSRRYDQFKGFYGEMRAIYGFYEVLEDEALAAGDATRAQTAQALRGRVCVTPCGVRPGPRPSRTSSWRR